MDKINELLNKATKIDREVNGEECKHLMNPETCISCEDEMNTEKRERELMEEEKRYYADIKITWGVSFNARNREEAIGYLRGQFYDDHDIELHDDEIIKLEEEE